MRFANIVLPLFLLTVGISSCKKDNDTTTTQTCQIKRNTEEITGKPTNFLYKDGKIERSINSSGNYILFHYNAIGNIDSTKNYSISNNLTNYAVLDYSADGKLISAVYYGIAQGTNDSFAVTGKSTFQYTGNNVTRTNSYDYPDHPTDINEYTDYVYDTKGNVISSKSYSANNGGWELGIGLELTYDDKKSYYTSNILTFLTKTPSSVNNLIAQVRTNYPYSIVTTDSLTYTYNENGYPTTLTIHRFDGSVYLSSFEYDCK